MSAARECKAMTILTVCKNVIAANNKRQWKDASPPIRVANTAGGKAQLHAWQAYIVDKNGEIVATIWSTQDGKPIVKCGAKVAIETVYPAQFSEVLVTEPLPSL
jgi:hypothetical protein